MKLLVQRPFYVCTEIGRTKIGTHGARFSWYYKLRAKINYENVSETIQGKKPRRSVEFSTQRFANSIVGGSRPLLISKSDGRRSERPSLYPTLRSARKSRALAYFILMMSRRHKRTTWRSRRRRGPPRLARVPRATCGERTGGGRT